MTAPDREAEALERFRHWLDERRRRKPAIAFLARLGAARTLLAISGMVAVLARSIAPHP